MPKDETETPLGPHSERSLEFGARMRDAFGTATTAWLGVRDLRYGPLGITELRYDAPDYGQSEPIPYQNALMLSLQLRNSDHHELWEDGRRLPHFPQLEGTTSWFDLRRGVVARSSKPFHCLAFNFPFDEIDGADAIDPRQLKLEERVLGDPIIRALGLSLMPALSQPERAPRLFVDHVLFALRAHTAKRFGQPERRSRRAGALAPWQERRAKEMIDAHLGSELSLAEIARACELSVAQFARAFKRSTGRPPYQYLLERRMERARELLLSSELPLADVAITCGFADQSHFTKAFQKRVGASPGTFRAGARSARARRR